MQVPLRRGPGAVRPSKRRRSIELMGEGEKQYTTVGIAVNRFVGAGKGDPDQDGKTSAYKTTWVNTVFFKGTAKFVAEKFSQGDTIVVQGELETSTYEKKDRDSNVIDSSALGTRGRSPRGTMVGMPTARAACAARRSPLVPIPPCRWWSCRWSCGSSRPPRRRVGGRRCCGRSSRSTRWCARTAPARCGSWRASRRDHAGGSDRPDPDAPAHARHASTTDREPRASPRALRFLKVAPRLIGRGRAACPLIPHRTPLRRRRPVAGPIGRPSARADGRPTPLGPHATARKPGMQARHASPVCKPGMQARYASP